jgi:hypothetical protein
MTVLRGIRDVILIAAFAASPAPRHSRAAGRAA